MRCLLKAVTSMEFEEIVGKLKATMDSPEMTQLLRRNEEWMYSWDNCDAGDAQTS
jgi:hypothetical protein